MSRLSDLTNQAIQNLISYKNETPKTLTTNIAINAAAAATIKSNNSFGYLNNGVLLYKAALANQSIAPTVGLTYIQPVSTTVYYTIGLDALGNVVVVQGTYTGQLLSLNPAVGVGVSQAGSSWVGDGTISDMPAGVTPVGIIKVVTNSSTTFTPGTTALDNAGITVTYFDVAILPVGKL